jgi:hypothetical protein
MPNWVYNQLTVSGYKDDVQHEQVIAFVWNKQDVEDILELEITDEE